MSDYGVTLAGFVKKTRQNALDELMQKAAQPDYFGPEQDLSIYDPIGQTINLMADSVGDVWEALEGVYYSKYVDTASGVSLDRAVAFGGISRRPPQYATVPCVVSGTSGTPIPRGRIVAQTAGGVQFRNAASGIIVEGVCEMPFVAEYPGLDGIVPAYTIIQLSQPYAGVNAITNEIASANGRDIETDVELRDRYKDRQATGGSSVPAIESALRNLSGVYLALVIENDTQATFEDGQPPHSVRCIVSGIATDAEIAAAIFNAKAGGISTFGNESYLIIDDSGEEHTIYWDIPTEKIINVSVAVTPDDEWDDAYKTLIKTAIVQHIGGIDTVEGEATQYPGLGIGKNVTAWECIAELDGILGMLDVEILLAEYPNSPDSKYVEVSVAEYPRCDTENITVEVLT